MSYFQSRTTSVNAHYFILLKTPRDRQQVEVFGLQVYPRKSHIISEDYEKATMIPYGYLVVVCIQQNQIVVGLERTYFMMKTTRLNPVA